MIRFLKTTTVLGLFALIGELFIRPAISIGGVGPDFTLITLAILALGEGALAATISGFVMGIILLLLVWDYREIIGPCQIEAVSGVSCSSCF